MMKAEDYRSDKKRPFTGAEYIESLRDGREVYINGERVHDVTSHPSMRNSVRSLARLYDALHDPAKKDILTTPTDTGNGGSAQCPNKRRNTNPCQTPISFSVGSTANLMRSLSADSPHPGRLRSLT